MGSLALDITLLILNIFNIFLHGAGFYLLHCLYLNGMDYSRHLLLMNLSLIEGLANFVDLLQVPITNMVRVSEETFYVIRDVQIYIGITYDCMFGVLYHLAMIFIVFDRFMDIFLSIQYPAYWSLKKTQYLLRATWAVAAIFAICACLVFRVCGSDITVKFSKYFTPIVDIIFVVISVGTYSFIFVKFKQTRSSPTQNVEHKGYESDSMRQNNYQSIFKIFRQSKFFISVLLIVSFIIFIVVPDLLNAFMFVDDMHPPYELMVTFLLFNSMSDLVDGYIYIFIQGYVRKLLWKKLRKIRCLEKVLSDRATSEVNISVVSTNIWILH